MNNTNDIYNSKIAIPLIAGLSCFIYPAIAFWSFDILRMLYDYVQDKNKKIKAVACVGAMLGCACSVLLEIDSYPFIVPNKESETVGMLICAMIFPIITSVFVVIFGIMITIPAIAMCPNKKKDEVMEIMVRMQSSQSIVENDDGT
jgi:hypothetical protein